MEAERWKQVDELLQSALQVPSAQRDEFLRQACAGDAGLEQEVRSLLASDQSAGDFLQGVAIKDAAQTIALNEVREVGDAVTRPDHFALSRFEKTGQRRHGRGV